MDGNPAGEFIPFLNKIPTIRNMKQGTLNCEKKVWHDAPDVFNSPLSET